ncbi:hypothetical protein [Spirulina subsalsa]|uniref:hypothetical protein n=1 Tax=Spirulina subsalsa TaxID=54311 RepID=UPI0003193DF1|nr:hypothetical protein [Spirulina subsalsa]
MVNKRRWLSAGMMAVMVLMAGCGTPESNAPSGEEQETPTTTAPSPSEVTQSPPNTTPASGGRSSAPEEEVVTSYPQRATFTRLQAGDLMCYTQVMDPQGQVFDLGATFELCDRQSELLNQTVRLLYSLENVADCESNEPCGKTRQETLISEVVLLGDSWQVWSNGQWTVTVGRMELGDIGSQGMTYYGCDAQNNCLALEDGMTICRNGICNMTWSNGDYTYTLSSEMREEGDGPTRLLVFQGERELVNAPGMRIVEASDS